MSDRNANSELFDAFLAGQMSQEEKEQFMHAIKNDEAFAGDFEIHKSMLATIQRQGRKELKAELKAIHQEKPRELVNPPVRKMSRRIPWLAAASVLLLVLAAWFFMRPMSMQQMAMDYYEPYELSGNLRNGADREVLATISNHYINKNYSAAIPLMQDYLAAKPNDHGVRLALAISLHENEQNDLALAELNKVSQSKDDFFQDHANWYAALFSLVNQDRAAAISNLKLLIGDVDADHYAEAKKLLDLLQ